MHLSNNGALILDWTDVKFHPFHGRNSPWVCETIWPVELVRGWCRKESLLHALSNRLDVQVPTRSSPCSAATSVLWDALVPMIPTVPVVAKGWRGPAGLPNPTLNWVLCACLMMDERDGACEGGRGQRVSPPKAGAGGSFRRWPAGGWSSRLYSGEARTSAQNVKKNPASSFCFTLHLQGDSEVPLSICIFPTLHVRGKFNSCCKCTWDKPKLMVAEKIRFIGNSDFMAVTVLKIKIENKVAEQYSGIFFLGLNGVKQ